MNSPKKVRFDSVTPCAGLSRDAWMVGGYSMTFFGSVRVCSGYQNCTPRICVAPSTMMKGFLSSSIAKTLPTGWFFVGCFVPRPTGPCTPTRETFILSTMPPSMR
jgi:hypothetical protein